MLTEDRLYIKGSGDTLSILVQGRNIVQHYANLKVKILNGFRSWRFLPYREMTAGYFVAFWGKLYPFMPSYDRKLQELKPPKLLLKGSFDERATFYPGTFDPWHLGHRACLDLCPADKILVLPDNNPWKEYRGRECVWALVRELALLLKDTSYSIYPGFLGDDQPNPTVSWLPLTKIKKRSLLVGEDSFLSLPRWKDAGILLGSLDSLFVCPRAEKKEDLLKAHAEIEKLAPRLPIIELEGHDYEHLSSTQLRQG